MIRTLPDAGEWRPEILARFTRPARSTNAYTEALSGPGQVAARVARGSSWEAILDKMLSAIQGPEAPQPARACHGLGTRRRYTRRVKRD